MSTRLVQLINTLSIALSLGLGGFVIGCGNKSEGPGSEGSGTPTPMAGMTGGGAGTAAPSGPSDFMGTIVESTQDKPITSDQLELTVTALDNVTGAPLAGKEAMTDMGGKVAFTQLPAEVGFKVKGVMAQAIDTYTFNIGSNEQGKLLRVVAKSSVLTVKTVANVTLNPELADLAGAIYWRNGAGQDEPVGCATVTIDDGMGEIRYFASNNLPTTNVALPSAPNLEVRTATNPLNGKFFITGASLKTHTVTATLNGVKLGSATLPVFKGTESTDHENAISLTDIMVEGMSANPTPADCK